MFLRTPYNYDRNEVSIETGLSCPPESEVVQSQKEESDINTIVRRFGLTGQLPPFTRIPQYGDFNGITDYHTAMNQVIAANDQFMKLPGSLRAKFNHDPEQYVNFCLDENNRDQLIEMGLIKKSAIKVSEKTEKSSPAGEGLSPNPEGSKAEQPKKAG